MVRVEAAHYRLCVTSLAALLAAAVAFGPGTRAAAEKPPKHVGKGEVIFSGKDAKKAGVTSEKKKKKPADQVTVAEPKQKAKAVDSLELASETGANQPQPFEGVIIDNKDFAGGKRKKKDFEGVVIVPSAADLRASHSSGFQGVVIVPSAEDLRKGKQAGFQGVVIVPAAEEKLEPIDGSETTIADAAQGEEGDIPDDLTEEVDDPFEGVNRVFFGFNEVVDRVILEPTARVYRAVLPDPVREGISNVLANAASPVILANDILQGRPEAAANTIKRFMVNSTIGVGGMLDAASYMGEKRHYEDFGQTLGSYGMGGGPYLVLPLIGPSNARDLGGKVVDSAINPMTWILYDAPLWQRSIQPGGEIVSGRAAIIDDIENLRKTSPDFYASVRDLYAQKRQADIANEDSGYDPAPGVSTLPPSVVPQTLNPY
jgi:phospholipid-binding lipoprotein MlaA